MPDCINQRFRVYVSRMFLFGESYVLMYTRYIKMESLIYSTQLKKLAILHGSGGHHDVDVIH